MKKIKKDKKLSLQAELKARETELESLKEVVSRTEDRLRQSTDELRKIANLLGVRPDSVEVAVEINALKSYRSSSEGSFKAEVFHLQNENARLYRLVRIAMHDNHVGKLPEDTVTDSRDCGKQNGYYRG